MSYQVSIRVRSSAVRTQHKTEHPIMEAEYVKRIFLVSEFYRLDP